MQSKQNPFKIGGWYNPLPEDQKSEEARIHWHPFPLKPLPIKEGAQSQGGQPEKLTDELLINQKLTCMGGIFFEQCFGAKEAEDQKAHTQRNLWQCKVCEECFVLCKECTKESERLREKMLEQSPEMLQAEELTLAYLDFFSQLRVEPPTTIPEYTWKNQFIDEIGDNRVERKYTRAAQKQASASQPQAEDKKEQGPPEEILAQAKKNAFNYLMKNRASIVVIGNQNVGKSTFLNKLLNLELLNTSNNRETAALWKIVFKKSSSTQALPQLGGAGIAGDAKSLLFEGLLDQQKIREDKSRKVILQSRIIECRSANLLPNQLG
ncbi:hypothetical protein FGO68_gene12670 [Halteria grandinella]|uniref:Dynamin N-terminal domain-containing protein n=1 Tax=Halteria grandinella TaxID=5974 RepID=A0A8J8NFU9_HALGN|nr:hypothetical protein FGO68_gene12670 [Halteria grandinella]